MARQSRIYIPQTAQLVQVRGINRAPVFYTLADYIQWQAIVRSIAPVYALDIHAYALTESQVVLLVTAHDADVLGLLMQDLGRRYVRYVNRTHERSGTLWEGRYRTAFVQNEPFVMNAYLWLDSGLNGQTEHTSALRHLGQQPVDFIRDHPVYWSLGNTPFERQLAYAKRMQVGLSQAHMEQLMRAVHTGWTLGDEAFIAQAESLLGRRIRPGLRGRPKKVMDVVQPLD